MHRIPIRGWAWVSRLGAYAIVCALPVIAVGLLLAADFRAGARERGREQAALVSTPPTIGRGTAELHRLDVVESHETSHLLGAQERDLVIGLSGLYVVLALIAAGVGVRLRRESTRNAFLADHDRITGLPNRRSFALATRSALQIARSTDSPAAIAIIDIDRFKAINDTLGYTNGDLLLCELARRLSDELEPGDLATRFGGDEFGIVLADGRRAEVVLRRLRERLGYELTLAGLTVSAQASIGYAVAPDDGADVDTLLARADIAMCDAKERRRGVVRYETALDRHDAASLGLVAELRHAIDDDQLVLHYQPQLHERSGRVTSLEALVRWQHPIHGLLHPDRFLPLAEQADDIGRLTSWVLRRALRDIVTVGEDVEDGGVLDVAVNVSARSLSSGGLAAEVLATLDELHVAPQRLTIEVTETAILTDPRRAAEELEQLTRAGVRISLDDFGRGQTSIGHFSALPLHELKIDRSFVGDMDSDATHAAIVRSLVQLGRNLGMQVVAEGVENETVRTQLREAGADVLQGYLICRPLPLAQIRAWLSTRTGTRVPDPVRAGVSQGVTVNSTAAR
jgi:diguanylate cyclase (GGDEF)-like protein